MLFLTVLLSLLASVAMAIPTEHHNATLTPRAPSTFTHPGVLIDRAQLDFIKAKVNAGAEVCFYLLDCTLRLMHEFM